MASMADVIESDVQSVYGLCQQIQQMKEFEIQNDSKDLRFKVDDDS